MKGIALLLIVAATLPLAGCLSLDSCGPVGMAAYAACRQQENQRLEKAADQERALEMRARD